MEYKDYGSVLITDLEQNAKILNRFIYKNIDSDEITLTYDKILSLIMEYEAVQRSYIHGNNYNEEYNYSNENNNYVNESEEEPLYNIYDALFAANLHKIYETAAFSAFIRAPKRAARRISFVPVLRPTRFAGPPKALPLCALRS